MPMSDQLLPQLEILMHPYFTKRGRVDPDARLVEDLNITGHDFFDLMSDIEQSFEVDLTEFFIGPDPQYVSTGWLGWFVGERHKPVFRDVSIREINEFLISRGRV